MGRLTRKIEHLWCVEGVGFAGCVIACRYSECGDCRISDAFTKLAHYEDLEEQGRLEVLPCKKGEDAYFIIENYIYGEIGDKSELHRQIFKRPFSLYEYIKHGKRAYATREEAEAKLKELEGVKE